MTGSIEGEQTLVVKNIGELVTCDPSRGVIRAAALVAGGASVAWVGAESDLPAELAMRPGQVVDAGGACVVPGFVDSHTHLVFAGERSGEFDQRRRGMTYEEVAAAGGGIASTVASTTSATDKELIAGAASRARAALSTGTTTIEVKTGYGLDPAAELRLLDVVEKLRAEVDQEVVATLLALHALRAGVDRREHLRGVVEIELPAAVGRAAFCDVFCERGAFSIEECEIVLSAAAALGFGLKLHAEQLSHTRAASLGARFRAASVDHLEHADVEDARAMASAGTVGVLLPGANLSLGGRVPPARMLIDEGVQVALATDANPGTSNTTDMRLMIALAVGLFNLTPMEALVAATGGGAAALRLPDRGALVPGRRCDLLVLDADTHVDLAYRLGAVGISRVFIGGRQLRPVT